jgi:hypothetical protein
MLEKLGRGKYKIPLYLKEYNINIIINKNNKISK